MKNIALIAGAAALAMSLFSAPAVAQQGNIPKAASLVNSAQVPGTRTAVGTLNINARGVWCTFNQSAEAGNPSTVISVEAQDAASGLWTTLASSGAVVNVNSPGSVVVYPGIQNSSLPAGVVGLSLKLPSNWRLKQVVTGGTSTTGTADCELLN